MPDWLNSELPIKDLLSEQGFAGSKTLPVSVVKSIVAGYERHRKQLHEANEKLIEATFHAQQQQAIAELAQRRQTEFLALLAHELRNPLAPLRSGLDVLYLAGDDAKLRTKVWGIMGRQIAQLVHLVDDLLDNARISTGNLKLKKKRVDILDVLEQSVETCMPLVRTAGQTLTVQVARNTFFVAADPLRLTQVFSNILSNATKYTPVGGHISVSAVRAGPDLMVSVQDTGIGIPTDFLPTIFEMFTQVPKEFSSVQGGLGIGLALVRQLVELHGGSVVAQSKGLGEGSTFTVRLPLAA